jgi:hypothetical protein
MNLKFYKKAILVTSFVNILAGASALIAIDLHIELFYGRNTFDPLLKFYHYNFWFAVMVMGIGYYYLSLKPIENRIFALVGGVVKLMIAGTWIIMFRLGEGKILLIGPILFDFFYGVLLLCFFYQTRQEILKIQE